jgi:hypothetical protein
VNSAEYVPASAAEGSQRGWLSASAAQRSAMRDVLGAFAVSRLVIWAVGVGIVALFGVDGAQQARLDPLGLTAPFGPVLDTLLAPAARFDSSWLLQVAGSGYSHEGTAAFFPLYPGLVEGLGDVLGSDLIAGLTLSIVTSLAGLYLVHRLTALDFGEDVARRTVWIMACFPTAFTLSSVYTEGLFLLLSVAAILAARLGRWNHAALAAFLAGLTRSAGILLVVPLALIYLYGPRADREPDRPPSGIRARYRLGRGAAILAAAPAGVLAFGAYLGLTAGNPLATMAAEENWQRAFVPLGGIWEGLVAAGRGLIDLTTGSHLQPDVVDPHAMGAMNLFLFAFLVLVAWLVVKGIRRLPVAYTGYAFASLALPLSTPALGQPLMSLPRFAMVLFPLWITLALVVDGRAAMRRVIVGSLVILAVFTGLFVTWIAAP